MPVHVVPVTHAVDVGIAWRDTTAWGLLLAVRYDDATDQTAYLVAAERNAAPEWVGPDAITHVELRPPS